MSVLPCDERQAKVTDLEETRRADLAVSDLFHVSGETESRMCIVVLRQGLGAASNWQQRYPLVTFLDAAGEPVPLPPQRDRVATSDTVALIEDTSWLDEGWCAAARSAFLYMQTAAAGGAVRIAATLPSRYQALGWSEYGAFAPKTAIQFDRPATAYRVPGNNMAFWRVELIEVMREQAMDCWKDTSAPRAIAFENLRIGLGFGRGRHCPIRRA